MVGLFCNGEVVLVTGGASGLGRVLVDMFVAEGAQVALTYKTSREKALELVEEHDGRVRAYHADASDHRRAIEVVNDVVADFGQLNVLVNNAASAKHSAFTRVTEDDMVYTFENTFMPVFNYSQAASNVFIEQSGGSIVQIGSINGERGREGSAPYSACKAAIEGLSKTIAKELGRFDVRCNVVSPGYIATEGQASTSPLVQKMVLDECAIRRLAEPSEIGNMVLFLASDKARNITGQVYRVDCGQYI